MTPLRAKFRALNTQVTIAAPWAPRSEPADGAHNFHSNKREIAAACVEAMHINTQPDELLSIRRGVARRQRGPSDRGRG